MDIITFNSMPEAIGLLLLKVEAIENRLQSQEPIKDESPKFLNIDEAAALLRKSKPSMYRLSSERRFPVYKNGKNLLFKENELKEFIAKSRRKTTYEIKAEIEQKSR